MKKYVKPEIFIEKFELSKHIADCAWELQSGNSESCHATPDPEKLAGIDGNLFNESNCEWAPGVNSDVYCYTNGAQNARVFAS